ncbi:MAG: GntR family transcriptional regulator [Meiothermus sp.]
MGILPVSQHNRVVDTVRVTLRRAILEGNLLPGQRLSVPELARQLKVSRSPVREAILQLVGEGLAVECSRKGVVVASPGAQDLLEISELREGLEGTAARLCALRAEAKTLAALREVLEFQRRTIQENNPYLYSDTNTRFHKLIAEGCGNGRLSRFLALLYGEMRLAFSVLAQDPTHVMRGYHEHLAVLEAIERRNPEAAEAAMRQHIVNSRVELEGMRQEQ